MGNIATLRYSYESSHVQVEKLHLENFLVRF